MNAPNVIVVIPARYGSTRLPGKPLVHLAGQPMIQRVYARAKLAQTVHRVIVATEEGFDPYGAPPRPKLRTTDDYLREPEKRRVT